MEGEKVIQKIIEESKKEECGWIYFPNIFYLNVNYIKSMTNKYNEIKYINDFHKILDIKNAIKHFNFTIYHRNEEYIIYGKSKDPEKRIIVENVFKRYTSSKPNLEIINHLVKHFFIFEVETLEGINNLLNLKYQQI